MKKTVVLANGSSINVEFGSGGMEIDAFHKGEAIVVRKRTTTIRITDGVGEDEKVIVDATVSCSHQDKFNKIEGRKAAWRLLMQLWNAKVQAGQVQNNILANTEDRATIANALGIVPGHAD